MYYVYKITFKDAIYIGCTNFLRRRANQHNENARKEKSKLGYYLKINGIVLKKDDLEVIYESENRPDALNYERNYTKQLAKEGVNLLNDIYSNECSRKGANLFNTAKHYVIVDYEEHTEQIAFCLRQWCLRKGLDYKLLQRTVNGLKTCYNRYKCFFLNDWMDMKEVDKEYFRSGKFLKDRDKANSESQTKLCQKTYKLLTKTGEIITVTNLDKFAKEHGINNGNLHGSYTTNHFAGGYKVIERC